jgi:hypothetical protein
VSEYLPLNDWGRCETVAGLQIDWNIPSAETVAVAQVMHFQTEKVRQKQIPQILRSPVLEF